MKECSCFLKASFNDRGLLMERVMSSAYAVSLGGYFVGLGTGEMDLFSWIWVRRGFRASIKRVRFKG